MANALVSDWCFQALGSGVWWTHTTDGFLFLDGENVPCMLHFRHHTIDIIMKRREKCWNDIIGETIPLSAEKINVYDKNGSIKCHLSYTTDICAVFHATGSDNNCIKSGHTRNDHTLNGPQSLSPLGMTHRLSPLCVPQSLSTHTDYTLNGPQTTFSSLNVSLHSECSHSQWPAYHSLHSQ